MVHGVPDSFRYRQYQVRRTSMVLRRDDFVMTLQYNPIRPKPMGISLSLSRNDSFWGPSRAPLRDPSGIPLGSLFVTKGSPRPPSRARQHGTVVANNLSHFQTTVPCRLASAWGWAIHLAIFQGLDCMARWFQKIGEPSCHAV